MRLNGSFGHWTGEALAEPVGKGKPVHKQTESSLASPTPASPMLGEGDRADRMLRSEVDDYRRSY
jgi:hypothetical protein